MADALLAGLDAQLARLVERLLRAHLREGQARRPLSPRVELMSVERIERTSAAGPMVWFVTRDAAAQERRSGVHIFMLDRPLADKVDAALGAADSPIRKLDPTLEGWVTEIREKGGARMRIQVGGTISIVPPRADLLVAVRQRASFRPLLRRPRGLRRPRERRRLTSRALARAPDGRPSRSDDDPHLVAGVRA